MKNLTKNEAIKEVKRINDYIENFTKLRKGGESSERTVERILGFKLKHYAGIYTIRDYLIWKLELKEEEYAKKVKNEI